MSAPTEHNIEKKRSKHKDKSRNDPSSGDGEKKVKREKKDKKSSSENIFDIPPCLLWDADQLKKWLTEEGFASDAEIIHSKRIDGETFFQDEMGMLLREIGIKVESRKAISAKRSVFLESQKNLASEPKSSSRDRRRRSEKRQNRIPASAPVTPSGPPPPEPLFHSVSSNDIPGPVRPTFGRSITITTTPAPEPPSMLHSISLTDIHHRSSPESSPRFEGGVPIKKKRNVFSEIGSSRGDDYADMTTTFASSTLSPNPADTGLKVTRGPSTSLGMKKSTSSPAIGAAVNKPPFGELKVTRTLVRDNTLRTSQQQQSGENISITRGRETFSKVPSSENLPTTPRTLVQDSSMNKVSQGSGELNVTRTLAPQSAKGDRSPRSQTPTLSYIPSFQFFRWTFLEDHSRGVLLQKDRSIFRTAITPQWHFVKGSRILARGDYFEVHKISGKSRHIRVGICEHGFDVHQTVRMNEFIAQLTHGIHLVGRYNVPLEVGDRIGVHLTQTGIEVYERDFVNTFPFSEPSMRGVSAGERNFVPLIAVCGEAGFKITDDDPKTSYGPHKLKILPALGTPPDPPEVSLEQLLKDLGIPHYLGKFENLTLQNLSPEALSSLGLPIALQERILEWREDLI